MSRLHRFHLLTAEEVQNSPSRADGVPESMESRRRKLAAQHMRDASFSFKMGITTWAIAVTFFNRFYARKSMKKNNTFVIACASLFLAGKVNDEPRSHEKLANELLKAWFGRDNPQLHALLLEASMQQRAGAQRAAAGAAGGHAVAPLRPPAFWTNMYEAVLEAERALLYTVGFDFNVEIIHTWLARLLNRPRFKSIGLKQNKMFQQHLIGIANDVYLKDATMVLQYSAEKIALAAFYLVFKAAKTHKINEIPLPEPGANGTPWYIEEGLSSAECVEITTRFTDRLYNQGQDKGAKGGAGAAAAAQRKPAASGATTTGAASTAMLGACESAAYSGGPSIGGGTVIRSELLSDAMGEHTSMPHPLGSDGANPAPSGSLKRPASGPPNGTHVPASVPAFAAAAAGCGEYPSKRARVAEAEPAAAASTEATSSAVAHPGLVGSGSHRSPAGTTPHNGPAAAPASQAAAVAAAAAADSDKEEGELEEGELS